MYAHAIDEILTSFSKRTIKLRSMIPLRSFIFMIRIKVYDAIKKFYLEFQGQGQFCLYFFYKSSSIGKCSLTVAAFTFTFYTLCTYEIFLRELPYMSCKSQHLCTFKDFTRNRFFVFKLNHFIEFGSSKVCIQKGNVERYMYVNTHRTSLEVYM